MLRATLILSALLIGVGPAPAAETAAKSRLVSVDLFKNGLAIVKREVSLPGPGSYRLDEVPEPIHGTYWVESSVRIESAVQMREVDVPVETSGVNLQEELAGKRVTVYFRSEKLTPLTGTVVAQKKQSDEPPGGGGEAFSSYRPQPAPAGHFLIMQTARGRAYVEPGDIAYYEAEGAVGTVKRRKPVLVLTASPDLKAPATVRISYLAHGLAWAPSYRLDTSDGHRLTLEQSAVIKNEMESLDGAEVSLITGFPSVQFAQVLSPLSTHTSWAAFFQQIGQGGRAIPTVLSNSVAVQAPAYQGYVAEAAQITVLPGHEGVDLFYQSIGKRTLARGDSLALTTRKGQADYERIVEWTIPDQRDAFGNPSPRPNPDADGEPSETAWDALRFKNPFAAPLTTGPAVVTTHGRFSGQRTLGWVNAGDETTLHVNKALSIRTRSVEHELQTGNGGSERETLDIGGRRFRRSRVQGELSIANHRSEPTKLLIRRRFSGDLAQAAGDPKVTLLEEGVYSVNKRNELLWTVTLKPGEEKTLLYQYTVLVAF
jgi:hypothetical protein